MKKMKNDYFVKVIHVDLIIFVVGCLNTPLQTLVPQEISKCGLPIETAHNLGAG